MPGVKRGKDTDLSPPLHVTIRSQRSFQNDDPKEDPVGKTGVSPGIFYCGEVSWSALEPPRVPLGGVGLIHPLPPGQLIGLWVVSWSGRIYTLEDIKLEHRATAARLRSRGHVTSLASSQDGLPMLRLTMSIYHPAAASHLPEFPTQGRWRPVPL